MGMTTVEKILAHASGRKSLKAGDVVEPLVDLAMSHENAALVITQFRAIFDGTDTAYFDSDSGVEFQSVAAGGHLGVAEDDPDLLSELVDEEGVVRLLEATAPRGRAHWRARPPG